MIAAILDWRDEDTIPRAGGAERAWSRDAARAGPADRPFEHEEEIPLVRGLGERPEIARLLGTTTGPLVLSRAEPAVLATIDGLGRSAITALLALRERSEDWTLADLVSTLSHPRAVELEASLPRIRTATILRPESWWLHICARAAWGAEVGLSARLLRSSGRVRVVEHRTPAR